MSTNNKHRPRVVILDNKASEADVLKEALSIDFDVEVVENERDLYNELRSAFTHFILLDVSLTMQRDTRGLAVGHELFLKYPGTERIATSAHTLGTVNAPVVIGALNPLVAGEHAIGRRVFYAFGHKLMRAHGASPAAEAGHQGGISTSVPDRADQYVRVLRAQQVGAGDRADILYDTKSEIAADIGKKFGGMRWQSGDAVGEFIECVKRLSFRQPLPAPVEVVLTKMGKGRSNTVVCEAALKFPQGQRGSPGIRPLRSLFKIGPVSAVAKEVSAFGQYVWQLFRQEQYPRMEATVSLNALGGMAYQFLESGTQPAGTLGDLAFDKTYPVVSALDLACEALDCRVLEIAIFDPGTLHEKLKERFHKLRKHEEEFIKQATFIWSQWNNENIFIPFDISRKDQGIVGLAISPEGDLTVESHLKFAKAIQSLQHGDFHSDNILYYPVAGKNNICFIDFADTGPHPFCLDYVVLEVALRFQLIRRLADIGRASDLALTELAFWAEFECKLLLPFSRPDPLEQPLDRFIGPSWGMVPEEVSRVLYLISGIRGHFFKRFVSSRFPRVAPVDAVAQYLGCVSWCSLSAMGHNLPIESKTTHVTWMASVFGVDVTAYNRIKEAKNTSSDDLSSRAWWLEHVFETRH